MYEKFFAQSELLFLPLVALGIFFVTFVLVVTHVVVGMKKRELISHVAGLPLDDSGERRCGTEGEGLSS